MVFLVNTIYSIAYYGESFALQYFGKIPLNLDKIIKLTISIFIVDIVMLISNKVASYIDNITEKKLEQRLKSFILTNYKR